MQHPHSQKNQHLPQPSPNQTQHQYILTNTPLITNLKNISLRSKIITSYGFNEIINKSSTQLQELLLPDCKIGEKGFGKLKVLGLELKMENLVFLNLDRNEIGVAGAKFLTRISMPRLKTLYLGFGQIRNQGARHIAKANWPCLDRISIDYSHIGLDGFIALQPNNWRLFTSAYIGQTDQPIIQILQTVSCIWSKFQCNNFWTWFPENDELHSHILETLNNRFPSSQYEQYRGQDSDNEPYYFRENRSESSDGDIY